jgi:hypothetical protein
MEGNFFGVAKVGQILTYSTAIVPRAGVTVTGNIGGVLPEYGVSVNGGPSVNVTISSLDFTSTLKVSESGTNVIAYEQAQLLFPDYNNKTYNLTSPLLNLSTTAPLHEVVLQRFWSKE